MQGKDIVGWSAGELAQAVRQGELSALEVAEAHIARIEAVNPRLNAVVVKRYDEARAEARAIDARRSRGEALGALAGVPLSIKECIDIAGLPSTFGLPHRAQARATADDVHVQRLRRADAVILGKTNVAQLLLFLEGDNPLYGRTANPWHPERSCGGSSGGEGAIIAARGTALGLGTDIGGSLRAPAAFCGISSLKPTAGRCPDPGRYSLHPGQQAIASQIGPLARQVDDLELALNVLNPPAAVDCPVPALADSRAVDVSRLRIGYYDDDGLFPCAPAVRRAVKEAAAALRAAGAELVPFRLPFAEALHLQFAVFTADEGRTLREALAGGPVHPTVKALLMPAGMPRGVRRMLHGLLGGLGQQQLASFLDHLGHHHVASYWKILDRLSGLRRECLQALATADGGPLDLLLGPAMSLPAFRHGSSRELGLAGAYTCVYNALGWPAGVTPWTRVGAGEESDRPASGDMVLKTARRGEAESEGLPIGVQLAGRPWREHEVLAAMRVVEAAGRLRPDYPAMPPV